MRKDSGFSGLDLGITSHLTVLDQNGFGSEGP